MVQDTMKAAGQTRFILVDDDESVNFLHKSFLELSYPENEVIEFADPVRALEFVTAEKCTDSLILLDINMPVLDGWQFLDSLQKNNIDCMIVVLTSSIDEDDRERAMQYQNVADFMVKPFKIETFSEIVNRLFDNP